MNGIANKRVMVTGATQGIGRAVAERFLQEGARVLLTDVVPETILKTTVAELQVQHGDRAFAHHLDVSDEASVARAFAYAIDVFDGLDILVNNAGISRQSLSDRCSAADFDDVVSVNLRGAFLCSRAALQIFLQHNSGVILNNSSVHEIIPKPEFIAYSVSKGGLGNLTRTLALEYADRGIRVNAVAPGATLTPMNDSWASNPGSRKNVESHIPIGRAATAADIAGAFAFLASDDAAYITGQTLYVDGGLTLYADFRTNWSS